MTVHREREAAATAVPLSRQNNQTVLWVIAVLLAVIATALVVRPNQPWGPQAAFGDSPMAGGRGIYAFTGQIDRNSYGLFMMNLETSTVWCYQYIPTLGQFRLVAARSFLYDRYLEDYKGGEPSPEEVKLLLEQERHNKNRVSRGGTGPEKPLEAADKTIELHGTPPVDPALDPDDIIDPAEQPTTASDE